eukprot:TRINITY_DN3368_c0_g3_i1.p1 TRINITY_DN3368_c0_g3~~TRINITY_DN3368_c0_g3_i1.p1  ORF type:complete len:432 (+),score=91.82 TRINITY_DN3368_c0_g3_i1:177-1472(+)
MSRRYVNEAKGPHLLSVITSASPTNRSDRVIVGVYKPGWYKLRPHDSVAKSGAEAFGEAAEDVVEEVKEFAKSVKSQGPANTVSVDALLQAATTAISEFAPTEIVAAGMSRSGKSTTFCAVLNKGSESFQVEQSTVDVLEFERTSDFAAQGPDEALVNFSELVKQNPKYIDIHKSIFERHNSNAFASARFRGPLVSVSEDDASSSIILPIARGAFWSVILRLLSREAIDDMREAVAKAVEDLQNESQDDDNDDEAELKPSGDYERVVQLFDLDKNCTMIEADPRAIRAAQLCDLFKPFVGQTAIIYRPRYNTYATGAEKIHDFQLQFVTEDWSLWPLINSNESMMTTPSPNVPWNVRIVDTPGPQHPDHYHLNLCILLSLACESAGSSSRSSARFPAEFLELNVADVIPVSMSSVQSQVWRNCGSVAVVQV